MPVCARVIVVDGENVLALSPAETNLATCAYVVESGPDLANSFLLLDAEGGAAFSAGVISCWMAAYGIRSIISVLKGSTNE